MATYGVPELISTSYNSKSLTGYINIHLKYIGSSRRSPHCIGKFCKIVLSYEKQKHSFPRPRLNMNMHHRQGNLLIFLLLLLSSIQASFSQQGLWTTIIPPPICVSFVSFFFSVCRNQEAANQTGTFKKWMYLR